MQPETRPKQRLVLCLDGTWNQQDSGTSIYNLSNLIAEGDVGTADAPCRQLVYYQPGVGTQVLDRVTGGAFGIGLSKNVRDAYDWLVETYCEGDEIYLFGFSRGAFTARSLAGLIAKCGLLYRGAPIPPDELWHGYQVLGRQENARTGAQPAASWWERIFGRRKPPFRELREMTVNGARPLNRAERLLVKWSRRVPIHCVGVFETVGSLGINSLAIPWFRDHTAQFHDASLSTLVVNGFHALAIDEHRANFTHIPWYRETDSSLLQGKTQRGGRLEQRWFSGAHSNVGGGYEDDVLAEPPLAWMIGQTKALGLIYRAVPAAYPDPAVPPLAFAACDPLLVAAESPLLADQTPALRDSYAELAGGIWKHFIRSKPEYRRIAPPPERQNGVVVQSVNETVDASVAMLQKCEPRYDPPNLWRYREDVQPGSGGPRPVHRYAAAGWKGGLCLLLWLGLIALAGWKLGGWLEAWPPLCCGWRRLLSWRWLAALLPALALLVDWRESVLNHETTLDPDGRKAEKRLAGMEVYLLCRLWAIAVAVAGAVIVLYRLLGPWLLRDFRSTDPLAGVCLLWLLALGVLFLFFQSAMSWGGGPMKDAGLSSVADLQKCWTPAKVSACLAKWARGAAPGGEQQVLRPVVRAFWRDRLAFIPAYSAVLFVGSWLGLSLGWHFFAAPAEGPKLFGLLLCDRGVWPAALAVVALCAAADYLEDALELSFVRGYPAPPSSAAVAVASAATLLKWVLFLVALLLTVGATLFLGARQLVPIWTGQGGTLSAVAIVFAAGAVLSAVMSARKH